eukprot:TRINITY_DN4246_c0_g1_i1.p1 TRINITY_DN4246_c0_g1~~TRINITY_DN4246_c0_g1_i1.p1  ORF type:complete len:663 (+),score=110.27 TRINITY_DN4246_c0_g1_i1:2-1990(+)
MNEDKASLYQHILTLLHIQDTSVTNAYIHGSRLYHTHQPTSDYDIIIILNDFTGPLSTHHYNANITQQLFNKGFIQWHSPRGSFVPYGDQFGCRMKLAWMPWVWEGPFAVGVVDEKVDVSVYHVVYWDYLIRHCCIRVMMCLYAPSDMVLKETQRGDVVVSKMMIKREVYGYVKKREKRAEQEFLAGRIVTAKKNLVHNIRVSGLGLQLIRKGEMDDLYESNHIFHEIMNTEFDSWEALYNWYLPYKENSYEILMEEVQSWKKVPLVEGSPYILQYLSGNNDDISSLEDISVTTKSVGENLYHLEHDNENPTVSPVRCKVIPECTGLILRESDMKWEIICACPRRPYNFYEDQYSLLEEKYVPQLKWEEAIFYIRYHGCYGTLFFLNGGWEVSFYKSDSLYMKEIDLNDEDLKTEFWSLYFSKNFRLPSDENLCYSFVFHPELKFIYCYSIVKKTLEELDIWDVKESYPSWSFIEEIEELKGATNESEIEQYLQKNLVSPINYVGVEAREGGSKITFWNRSYLYLTSLNEMVDEENYDFKGLPGLTDRMINIVLCTWNAMIPSLMTEYYKSVKGYLEEIFLEIDSLYATTNEGNPNKGVFAQRVKGIRLEEKSILFSLKNLGIDHSEEYFSSPQVLYHDKYQSILSRLVEEKIEKEITKVFS